MVPETTGSCQDGFGKTVLIPPPVAPPVVSFQTTSWLNSSPDTVIRVPPHPTTCGLDAGKSTWLPGCRSGPGAKSLAPLSPDAQ